MHFTLKQLLAHPKWGQLLGLSSTKNDLSTKNRWKQGWYTIGGKRIYFRSKWEATYANYLEFLKRTGVIKDWQYEPYTFWFESIKRGTRSYKPDFKVTFMNDCIEWHEVKGYLDPKSKTKLKRMKKYFPGEKVVLIDKKWFNQQTPLLRSIKY